VVSPETTFRLIYLPSGAAVARVVRLDGWWAKGRGVIGRPPLPLGEGVWLPGVAAVHSFFVSAAMDLVFLDAQYRTLRLLPRFPPWRPMGTASGACHTLELGAGTLAAFAPVASPGDAWRLEGM
jgi:hypothetical protein